MPLIFFKRILRITKQKKLISSVPKNMSVPKTIKDFGYAFNTEGQLRKVTDNGEPGDETFQFNVSDQHQECQAHYEDLGNAITDHVYHLLEQEGLHKLPVPADLTLGSGTFIFVSKEYDKKNVLIILINGSGAVRAGQWARSLIINECLDKGTQIPYIRRALQRDFGVVVLNTNDNSYPNGEKIPHSSNAEEHAKYVWDTYVSKCNSSAIVIVAHSYGGVVTVTLADQLKQAFEKRVKAVAFTDSVHSYSNFKITQHLKEVAKNWISHSSPVDTPVNTPDYDITRVSAGHPKHEMTSSACIDSVFKFIDKKVNISRD